MPNFVLFEKSNNLKHFLSDPYRPTAVKNLTAQIMSAAQSPQRSVGSSIHLSVGSSQLRSVGSSQHRNVTIGQGQQLKVTYYNDVDETNGYFLHLIPAQYAFQFEVI